MGTVTYQTYLDEGNTPYGMSKGLSSLSFEADTPAAGVFR